MGTEKASFQGRVEDGVVSLGGREGGSEMREVTGGEGRDPPWGVLTAGSQRGEGGEGGGRVRRRRSCEWDGKAGEKQLCLGASEV